ncbi:hypothetical protein CCP3SC1AL1_1690002 [Gammaproteobacteria bacterium]
MQILNKWTTTAGPRQTKAVEQAIKQVSRAGEGSLVIDNYGEAILWSPFSLSDAEKAHKEKQNTILEAIHAKYAGLITAENYRQIEADCLAECPALEAARPVRAERTSEQEQAEKRARFAAAEQVRKLEQAEREKARALEADRLLVEFSHLERVKPGEYASQTLAARNIRTELKRAFPGHKFSVTSESFSMGDSVDISWVDGPTVKAVEAITNRYSKGHFDGMEDIYNYNTTAFTDTFGGSKYVHTHRQVTCYDTVKAAIMETFGPSFGEGWEKEQHADRMARNELAETDLTGKGAFLRRDYNEETYKWTLVFEELTPAPAQSPATITADGYRIEEHTHTKKGFQMWIVVLCNRTDAETFKSLTEKAKLAGGWYSRQWGPTPGGFAFKEKGAAESFAAGIAGNPPPEPDGTDAPSATPATPPAAPTGKAERLRAMADGLAVQIADKRREMTQNATPKRSLQYRARILEADDLERAQTALYRLADGLQAGTLPAILHGYSSKAAILDAVTTRKDTSGGYYSITCTGKFRDTSARPWPCKP